MSNFTPKGYISCDKAITRIGRSLSDEWTGEEFASAVASMAKINRDTQTYFIGWVAEHCINAENIGPRRTVENPNAAPPLSTLASEQWDRASTIYEEARSIIDGIVQFESIKAGGGHLAKILNDPERGIVWEWPEDFPLSKDNLKALKVEEEEFRAPREAAYKRLDDAARLLQQELCGTPPDCEDAIPALWRYPDRPPDRIDPTSWSGLAGLDRLKRAARDNYQTPGNSRVIISSEHIERLCAPPDNTAADQPRRGRRPTYDWTAFQAEIARKVGTDPDGFPVIQADLEREMTKWCEREWGEDKCPVESTIRGQVSIHYSDEAKAGK